jgi:murein DD-endopeptidase MepM/ murein hydrolase activator NlpD
VRIVVVYVLIAVAGITCELPRPRVLQGETIRLTCDAEAASARLLDRTFQLFKQADGKVFGLLPVPAGTAPGAKTIAILATDSRPLRTLKIVIADAHFPEQNVTLSKSATELAPAPGETERIQTFRQLVTSERHWAEPFTSPVPGCMTSPFGVKRMHNGHPTGSYHGGVDQRSASGRPIRAAAAGIVRLAGKFEVPGNAVGIDHGQGLTSMYSHLSKIAVSEGTRVERGDIVGYVGTTGRSNAPHLHWGLAVHAVNVNPLQWVSLQPCAAAK